MLFVIFAVAVAFCLLSIARWLLSPSRRGRRTALLAMLVVAAAAIASIVSDARVLRARKMSADSRLHVQLIRWGDWFELQYERDGQRFATANEMHIPAGSSVVLSWLESPEPWIDGSVCLSRNDGCTLLSGEPRIRDARFLHLFPYLNERLRVVVEPQRQFDAWFALQMQPALSSDEGGRLFSSAGCDNCHVIRGVVNRPGSIAPDLTHFASRPTIAGTRVPISGSRLAGWIVEPRALKPHTAMPPNPIDPAVLDRLVSYLMTLR